VQKLTGHGAGAKPTTKQHSMMDVAPCSASRKAVVLLSGGLDSMVVAALARERSFEVCALTIDYNQRHRIELAAADRIARRLNVARHLVLPLDLRSMGGSALTSGIDVPKSGLSDEIPVTYVPARNLVFLSLALAWAESLGALDLFIGVNALDYSGYPDCRPDFVAGFENLAQLATRAGVEGGRFRIHAPLQHMRKADIALEARRLGLDPAESWSCYDPTVDGRACGLCDSCRLRLEAMKIAGVHDGTRYAAG
jgi:7-cyano-7-deazaguanine synthase